MARYIRGTTANAADFAPIPGLTRVNGPFAGIEPGPACPGMIVKTLTQIMVCWLERSQVAVMARSIPDQEGPVRRPRRPDQDHRVAIAISPRSGSDATGTGTAA